MFLLNKEVFVYPHFFWVIYICLICVVWCTLQCEVELQEMRSQFQLLELRKHQCSCWLRQESNLFEIELTLRWAKINLFKFSKRMYFRIFCGFSIGYADDVTVSLKLAEIFDSSEQGNSASINLYTDSLTLSSAILQELC